MLETMAPGESVPAKAQVTRVALEDIETDEDTFQWRMASNNIGDRERHIQELSRALTDRRRPLDPILVLPKGSKFVVVDGHHRHEAYKTVKWDRHVPVEVFQGTPQEAELEALRRNIKDKLPMTQEDKLEAAWRLVLAQKHSKVQITEMTTISNGTLGNMRSALEKYGREAVAGAPWSKVKLMRYDLDDDFDYDEHRNRKAEKLAKELVSKSSVILYQNPEILALALEIISGSLPKALVEQWWYLAEEIVEERSSYPDI